MFSVQTVANEVDKLRMKKTHCDEYSSKIGFHQIQKGSETRVGGAIQYHVSALVSTTRMGGANPESLGCSRIRGWGDAAWHRVVD